MVLRASFLLLILSLSPWNNVFSSEKSTAENGRENDSTLFTASYRGKHSGLTINMTKSLVQTGENQYVLRSKAKAFIGSISEESHFLLIDSNLIPVSYRYFRSIFAKKSDQRIIFDWKTNTARYTRSDKPHKNAHFDIYRGVLDPALYQLKLQHELSTEAPELVFDYAKNGSVKKIEFGNQTVTQFDMGDSSLSAIKVERINDKKEKHTEITLIPEFAFQVAEVVHREKSAKAHVVRLQHFEHDQTLMDAFYAKLSAASQQSTTQQNLAQNLP